MHNVLIVSSIEKNILSLKEMIVQNHDREITTAAHCGEARRLLIDRDFDLCVINTPLSDEFGDDFACDIASAGIGQVILIVRSEIEEMVAEKVEGSGVLTIAKPINKALFWSALKLAAAAHHKMSQMKEENRKLQQRIEDIRLVDRAKWIMVESLGFSEAEAHRYIEKQAMDRRMPRREVAEQIIQYGLSPLN